jgi:hypothetical protein
VYCFRDAYAWRQHGGSAHGGHYHALIRDMLGEGSHTAPEQMHHASWDAGDNSQSALRGWKKLVARSQETDKVFDKSQETGAHACVEGGGGTVSGEALYDDRPELLVRDIIRQWTELHALDEPITPDDIIRGVQLHRFILMCEYSGYTGHGTYDVHLMDFMHARIHVMTCVNSFVSRAHTWKIHAYSHAYPRLHRYT